MRIHLHTPGSRPAGFRLSASLRVCAPSRPAADFEVFPNDMNLKTKRDQQSLVVRITEPNGVHRDVTDEAKFSIADPAKAKVEKGMVYPVADGETTLKVE